MGDCVFCDILVGTRPASVVYLDEVCCAFMDIQPVNPGHTLVVPLEHCSSLSKLSPETGSHLFVVGQRLAAALYLSGASGQSIRCEGVNLFLADGPAAGQDVFHFHLHIYPCWKGKEVEAIVRFAKSVTDQENTTDEARVSMMSKLRSGLATL